MSSGMALRVVAVAEPPAPPPSPPVVVRQSKRKQQPASSISDVLSGHRRLSLRQLKQVHAQLYRRYLHHHPVLLTHLISSSSSSSSSSSVSYAARLFHSFAGPHDLVLLNAVLRAYSLASLHSHSLSFFLHHLLLPGFLPDRFTFPYLLKSSAALSAAPLARQLHAALAKNPATSADALVLNSLTDAYFKCGDTDCALRAFAEIRESNATSWNIVLSGLSNSGDVRSARALFDGMPDKDVVSWNTLTSAYARAGDMLAAQELFDRMPERNLVSWNALISGYTQNGRNEEALLIFSRMVASGVRPDDTTLLSVLSACAGAQSWNEGVVGKIMNFANKASSVAVLTALLNLYAKIGRIEEAREVFDRIREKDLVTWNAMIGGYSQNRRPVQAIELFRMMQTTGIKPDSVTMVSLIHSCSQMGALCLGEWVHAYIRKNDIEMDVYLMTALIDMYAKCGDLSRARLLFSGLKQGDLASWNAMINGFAVHGCGREALEVFASMERDGVAPNDITFVGLLSACSHGGLVDKGLELFESMQNRYGIAPRIEHYGCVVDLLGRAGQLAKANEFVHNMPIKPDEVVWGALLGACRCHNNVELAEEAARRLVELDPGHDGNYVLLSNVYASLGKWSDVEKVRTQMRERQVRKTPGCSAVEMDGAVHEFIAGDRSHPNSEEIYAAWDQLVERLKPMGYSPDTGALLKNLDEEDKEASLYRHSEKLALSFALISLKAGLPIRIVKNLRICNDCHRTMELVSKLEHREIIVRDRSRFHHFNAGRCSCGGYW